MQSAGGFLTTDDRKMATLTDGNKGNERLSQKGKFDYGQDPCYQ
jgi:hypothetical protein